jgi:hypothetical protein
MFDKSSLPIFVLWQSGPEDEDAMILWNAGKYNPSNSITSQKTLEILPPWIPLLSKEATK